MSEVPGTARRSRSQVVLGCIGLVLFATGILLAAVTAGKEWEPPVELSVVHDQAGRLFASVEFGSTGPTALRLEVVAHGKVLWSFPLARHAAAQRVILPSRLLGPKSRVVVVSKGHTLREASG